MIERFTGQSCKDAICELVIENPSLPTISKAEWKILESLLNVLRPIKDATIKAQHRSCSIASIIPSFKIIEHELVKAPRTIDFPLVRKEIVEAIKWRIGDFMFEPNMILATILDPFYKMAFFDPCHLPRCKDILIQTVENSIKSDQCLPDNVQEFEDDDPIERYLSSKEVDNEGEGPSQLQICSPPILDEKLRAIHVYYLILFFYSFFNL